MKANRLLMTPVPLRDKLRNELREDVSSEMQAVCILVLIIKLLEATTTTVNYPALKFHCDWATHAKMERATARRIVERFDEWHRLSHEAIASNLTAPGPDNEFLAGVYELTALSSFRKELAECLWFYGLDASLAADGAKWAAFVDLYLAVVTGCPLSCQAANFEFVDEVWLTVLDVAPPEVGGLEGLHQVDLGEQ